MDRFMLSSRFSNRLYENYVLVTDGELIFIAQTVDVPVTPSSTFTWGHAFFGFCQFSCFGDTNSIGMHHGKMWRKLPNLFDDFIHLGRRVKFIYPHRSIELIIKQIDYSNFGCEFDIPNHVTGVDLAWMPGIQASALLPVQEELPMLRVV